ncbi:MAG: acetyl-CoA acetyltransferase [Rickettsiales bacterium]|jgi:acetyl-CoA acyltransferase|nr:acetyl-CoA acetyltransferase [Rickettsiales bacterium]
MTHAVIAGYVRSPFTPANKGELAKIRPDEILAQVLKGLIAKTKVNADDIEDVILGCAFPEGEQGLNVARLAVLLADLPKTIGGCTINRFCGSSMQSIHNAAGMIAHGAGEVFICAGVESMTRIPMGGFNPLPHPGLFERFPDAYISMGITAENLARKYKISRKDQEAFAVESHKKAAAAIQAGKLKEEIIAISDAGKTVDQDGCVRADANATSMANLEPAFEQNGTVTAATSSPLTDGASAVLVCSESYADKHGLPKLARIKSFAISGCEPGIMGIGPVASTKKALARAGLQISDIDIFELNEAFSVQALSCIEELKIDIKKINLDGGAIALGHPLGATGARITGKAAALLKREDAKYALSTQCIGGGQGIATILERI